LTVKLISYWRNAQRDYVLELDNGQIWQALDGSTLSIPQDANEVTIKKSLFGGFKMTVRNQNRRGVSGKV